MQVTLTLKMTTARIVGTSVTVNNSPIQDYVHLDDHPQPTYLKYNNYAEICDLPAKHPIYDFSPCSSAWSSCSLCLLFKLLCLQSNTGECFLTFVMPLFSYILINTFQGNALYWSILSLNCSVLLLLYCNLILLKFYRFFPYICKFKLIMWTSLY